MLMGFIIGTCVGIIVGVASTVKFLIWNTKRQIENKTEEEFLKTLEVGKEHLGLKYKDDPTQSVMNAWDEYRNQDSFDA